MNQLFGIYFLLLTIGFGLLFRAAWTHKHTLLPAKGFIVALAFAALWSFGTAIELLVIWLLSDLNSLLAESGFALRMIGYYGASVSLYLSASLFAYTKPDSRRVMFFTLPICFFVVVSVFHASFAWQGQSFFINDFAVRQVIFGLERLVFEPQVMFLGGLVYVLFLLAISITPLVFSTHSQKSFWQDTPLLVSLVWSVPLVLMFLGNAGATGWDLGSSGLVVTLLGNWVAYRQGFFIDSPALQEAHRLQAQADEDKRKELENKKLAERAAILEAQARKEASEKQEALLALQQKESEAQAAYDAAKAIQAESQKELGLAQQKLQTARQELETNQQQISKNDQQLEAQQEQVEFFEQEVTRIERLLNIENQARIAFESQLKEVTREKEQLKTQLEALEQKQWFDEVTGLPNNKQFARNWEDINDFCGHHIILVVKSQKPLLETREILVNIFPERVYHLEESLFCIWLEATKPEDAIALANKTGLRNFGLASTLLHPHSRLLEFAKTASVQAKLENQVVLTAPKYEFWQRGVV